MQKRPLGPSGIPASIVGYGAWAIGGWMWGGQEADQAVRSIHAAVDAGIDLIDTAPAYGFGASEELLGKALKGKRNGVILATKCGLVWDTDKGDYFFTADENSIREDGEYKVMKYLGPESIERELEASLRRLQTDVIDLYQTHWQESTTPIEETMACLVKLRDQGKIRAIGVSNATPEQMDLYREIGRLDADQERYSMLDRVHENDNMPYTRKHAMAFLAYSPIAQGLLTGKMGPDYEFGPGDQRRRKDRFGKENRRRVRAMLDELEPIAEKNDLTLTQLVIAWTAAQPTCTHVLVGARTEKQARENAVAGTIRLPDGDVLAVGNILKKHQDRIV